MKKGGGREEEGEINKQGGVQGLRSDEVICVYRFLFSLSTMSVGDPPYVTHMCTRPHMHKTEAEEDQRSHECFMMLPLTRLYLSIKDEIVVEPRAGCMYGCMFKCVWVCVCSCAREAISFQ